MDSPIVHQIYERSLDIRANRLEYSINERGCWECVSHGKRKGYALVNRNGAQIGAHRHVYQLKYGRLPGTLVILHKCDNPICINPDHLEPGTQKQNMADKMAKGRGFIPGRGYYGQEISNPI